MERHAEVLMAEEAEERLQRRDLDGADPAVVEEQTQPLLGVTSLTSTTGNGAGGYRTYDGADRERGEDADNDEDAKKKWWQKPSVFLLIPPFLLYASAFGAIAVPRVNLILGLICQEYFKQKEKLLIPGTFIPIKLALGADNPECEIPEIGAKATMFSLYMNIIAGLLSAITAPRLGELSDRYGRRKLMILTTSGGFISEILVILCFKFPDQISYWWLLLASTVEGCLGSFTLSLALTHSYASDCTSFAKRASAFSLFHGCLFLGIAIGPAIGGLMIDKTHSIASVFYLAIAVHVVFMAYIAFVLPESLSVAKQMIAREKWEEEQKKLAHSTGSSWFARMRLLNVLEPLNILWPDKGSNVAKLRLNMILIAAIDFVMFGVGFGAMTVVIVYSKVEFHWQTKFAAYYTSIVNSTRVLGLFVFLPLITRFFRKKPRPGAPLAGCDRLDIFIVQGALTIEIIGYLFFVFARSTPWFVAGGVIQSFGGVGSPTLQSSLTKHSPAEKTGQLLGAIALLHAVARVVGPTAFNSMYSKTAETYPQATFTVLVALFGLAWIASWFITPGLSAEGVEEDVNRRQGEEGETERLFASS